MKVSEIPKSRLNQLNQGLAATANLTEWLAVDQAQLLEAIAKNFQPSQLTKIKRELPSLSVPKQIAWIGGEMSKLSGREFLESHVSDLVRCWACYARTAQSRDLQENLKAVKTFAADAHFGIREIAWMAVREQICESPHEALHLLIPWAQDSNPFIRRFASEATRPRGVWAKHILAFKKDPSPARPLLDLLSADPEKYVQDSVANWLNDAGKDNPAWVKKVVSEWGKKSASKETAYIVKRATRSL